MINNHINKHILIIQPDIFIEAIQPLIAAYKKSGISSTIISYPEKTNVNSVLPDGISGYNAVLLIGVGNRAPKTVLEAPFIFNGNQKIPIGWLPIKNEKNLIDFANTAAEVHTRRKGPVATAILAQRHPRFLRVAERMATILREESPLAIYKWTSDLLAPEEMIRGLRTGLGCAIYLGHGRPLGWVGYYGARIRHFTGIPGKPLGAVISLCCHTASRRRNGLSFSEALILNKVAAASFGAVTKTLHTDNTRWAVRIGDSLKKGISTLGDLITDACPPEESAYLPYRIMGDPLAPLFSYAKACREADKIKVYP